MYCIVGCGWAQVNPSTFCHGKIEPILIFALIYYSTVKLVHLRFEVVQG